MSGENRRQAESDRAREHRQMKQFGAVQCENCGWWNDPRHVCHDCGFDPSMQGKDTRTRGQA